MQAEQAENNRVVETLMDPANKLENVSKDEFAKMLKRDGVFDEVANRVFTLWADKNQRMNEEYPLMVRMETSI